LTNIYQNVEHYYNTVYSFDYLIILRGENLKMSDYCIYKEPDFMLIFALVILQRKVDIRLTVNQ